MDQKKRSGLKGLLASRNKEGKFKRGPQNATSCNSPSSSFYGSWPTGYAKFEENEARSPIGGR